MRANVEHWERAASIALGLSLVGLALKRRRTFGGLALAGASLVARGASGLCPANALLGRNADRDDTRYALGGRRGIHLRETVTIARPPADVFAYWRHLENLPHFMRHLDRVEVLAPDRSRWTLAGPAGMELQWDAEIINELEPGLLAWRSLPGSDVASAGSVHFRPRQGGTDVAVTLQYDAPLGKAGTALASLFGRSPSSVLQEDLKRLKALLESPAPQADKPLATRALAAARRVFA